jgi:N6-adenosine-specific RNA methylase IME4
VTLPRTNLAAAAHDEAALRNSLPQPGAPTIVRDLRSLVESGMVFSTIYADPPWPYSNTAARGAAENHYRTLTLEAICAEPVKELVADAAHLHLWTTNAFLREAFDVIRAWGFHYKSCLVWIKPQLGMGNYWRVSHEYLLLGVRGNLPFQIRTVRSWQLARRTIHSRKPFLFRGLIEQVSPGPYLELYGREEQPNTGWTVYGNQVERKLF